MTRHVRRATCDGATCSGHVRRATCDSATCSGHVRRATCDGATCTSHIAHRTSHVIAACAVALIASMCAALSRPVTAAAPDVGTEAQREAGKKTYLKYCSQCHGEKGDGEGYAASHLRPKPRNFTTGKFKIRTTPNGALPTHEDLVSIIRRGMPYTSMPGWPNFSDEEVSDLAYFITTFSPEFSKAENEVKPVPLPGAPKSSKESVELGKKLYADNGCVRCHGTLGRGDGPSAPTLTDDWGHPIRPADLAQSWTFRGGSTREDIFRTMSTGLNGTPMPSFLEALKPEERWAITDFIDSLSGGGGPGYTNLVIAKHVEDPIDLAKGASSFQSARLARFPIIGQITEPVRDFHPPTTSVTVQAIYDADSIALLVRWHDMSAEKAGKNGPSLPVPHEEEEEAAPPASGASGASGGSSEAGGGASPWGDAEASPATAAQTPAAQQPANPFEDQEAAPAAAASEFSDAVAIQIPSQVPTGARKPYFIFGDGQNSVDLWFYDLARPNPLQFTGKGSTELAPNDTGDLTGVASYDQGEWSVIFKRPLRPSAGAPFTPGQFLPIAFSVWDGFSRERGNHRGLSVWYSIYLEPEAVPSVVGPMIETALIILFIELAIVGYVRWRYSSKARQELGAAGRQQPATGI
jgi:cytochrome c